MLFKIGDTVTIRQDIQGKRSRTDEGIQYHEYDSYGRPANGYLMTNWDGEMRVYAGMKANIIETKKLFFDTKCYILDIDHGHYLWTDEMFEEREGPLLTDIDCSELFGFIAN